jgi:M6 family metalloprotease-like protein
MCPVSCAGCHDREADVESQRSSRKDQGVWARFGALLIAMASVLPQARAEDIVQGTLQLRWGDARSARVPAQMDAWLELGPGLRYRLDPVEASRAAGDLPALSNRRVAVSYLPRKTTGTEPAIEAIVPAGRLPQRAAARDTSGRIAMAAPVVGNSRWVTLMCRFADLASEPKSRAFFQAQYGDAPGQLGHYWSEVSYGAITLAGSGAYGWYALPGARADYIATVGGKPRADLSRLFSDCTAQAEADVDFRDVQGINLVFNGELDGRAWGGGACGLLEGVHACTRATWSPPWASDNVASLAHEMGHGYGLAHSDNSDGDADTHDNPWDLMSDAWRHAASDPVLGLLPKHLSMHQRDRLGWVAPARRYVVPADNETAHDIVLDAASVVASGQVQLVVLAGPAQPDPYRTVSYTLEARRRSGTYESRLAGDAVILHRLADNGVAYSVDTDTPPADLSGNEGSMLKVGEQWNTPDGRHWVTVVAATATGFRVRVGPRPRVMSAPAPALLHVPSAASAKPRDAAQADDGESRRMLLRPGSACRLFVQRRPASVACAPVER